MDIAKDSTGKKPRNQDYKYDIGNTNKPIDTPMAIPERYPHLRPSAKSYHYE